MDLKLNSGFSVDIDVDLKTKPLTKMQEETDEFGNVYLTTYLLPQESEEPRTNDPNNNDMTSSNLNEPSPFDPMGDNLRKRTLFFCDCDNNDLTYNNLVATASHKKTIFNELTRHDTLHFSPIAAVDNNNNNLMDHQTNEEESFLLTSNKRSFRHYNPIFIRNPKI